MARYQGTATLNFKLNSNKLYLTLDNHSPESLVVKSISGAWSEKTSASSGVEKFLKNVSLGPETIHWLPFTI